jgi:hypothetical protein
MNLQYIYIYIILYYKYIGVYMWGLTLLGTGRGCKSSSHGSHLIEAPADFSAFWGGLDACKSHIDRYWLFEWWCNTLRCVSVACDG